MTPFALWQWIDSAFPAGGFAHSGGIEAAWQAGEVDGPTGLRGYLVAVSHQAVWGSLAFVLAAYDAPNGYEDIDAQCDAFLSNHIANRASRRQGQAMLRSAVEVFDLDRLRPLAERSVTGGGPTHLAPTFGVIGHDLSVERATLARAFIYIMLRDAVSASVRLSIVGPIQGQRLLRDLAASPDLVPTDARHAPCERATQTAPMLDLFQATQDRLYSRLFQS